ncbi:MAG TPA: YggS family pyridoxal phosphate-dependent enzyme [Chitinophagaceae bacterium]|nr:YggS family pyridoxal phosphate-dependent enzyme [Chitinophagaceae bacterium]
MAVNKENYNAIIQELAGKATLVAVSKTKPVEDILALYALGQRDFGENYVQELLAKQPVLPADIRWHFIGHLQSNKVKFIAPLVALIHGVDSVKLLSEINRQAEKLQKTIHVLLQVHIAKEETKFGMDEQELAELMEGNALPAMKNICISGLMGMASFTTDETLVQQEFSFLASLYKRFGALASSRQLPNVRFSHLSMGMSGDYRLAIANGSNMVRIGSLLFGEREKK